MIVELKDCLVPVCEGATHRWEFERPTLRELKRIQETIGMDPDEFETAMNDGLSSQAIDAILVLVDILHRRNKVVVPFDEIDADIQNLDFIADPAPEPEPGKEPATTISLPREDVVPASSTSGPSPEVASGPRSSAMAQTSGGGTGSP